ncbi:hypothetical protein SAMN05216270_10955 [Glycomyces harbinensis]|uniref:Uncharacterized protein n=1 Tax=Glycomyces harbinensis TaxID=58114 RepID=A0A1G6YMA8_9ACTN|nr:hypothetical protein SAMN05216270_10955 [Glycomyces harbinensis]
MHEGPIGPTSWTGPDAPPRRTGRPHWREPHPVRVGPAAAGSVLSAVWALMWLLAYARSTGDTPPTGAGFAWVTLAASTIGLVAAAALARYGDRGAAVGVAAVAGTAAGVAGLSCELYLFLTGDWILWLHQPRVATSFSSSYRTAAHRAAGSID